MKTRLIFSVATFLVLALALAACNTPAPTATLPPASTPFPASFTPRPPEPSVTPLPSATASSTAVAQPLPPLAIDWSEPFGGEVGEVANIPLTAWTPQPYMGQDIPLPLDLDQVRNVEILAGLTADQMTFLAENGFVVIHSQEAQFDDIRWEAFDTGQPYYLTTDAAFHALHLLFNELLKSLEREYFHPQMVAITRATLDRLLADLPAVQNTSIETDTQQALAYLSVALRLLDPNAEIDPSVESVVSQQVDQIMAADGRGMSVLFPGFEDDYGAYKPVGHYAGDPGLETYFRAMTWYGHVHFRLQAPEDSAFAPSRLPLIITLALRRAQVDGRPASDTWADMHKILTFIVGPSDDTGPLEYAALMDQVYGDRPQIQDLADESLWQDFLARADQLPAPQINSQFVLSAVDLAPQKGWRLMGQRFTLDSLLFQNLIFDRVQAKPDGTIRDIPSGLDVMATFGSSTAWQELEKLGATDFPNYTDQMQKMQHAVLAQPAEQWLGRFYDSWLYSFFPMLQAKDSAYPAFMQTSAWGYKDLNTALGSWAELKHDTILYTKLPEVAGGGASEIPSPPVPSYVEPNPAAFYRMAYIAQMLSCGLQGHVLRQSCHLGETDVSVVRFDSVNARDYILGMGDLGVHFEMLGQIAAKELAGIPVDASENRAITKCLGIVECKLVEASPVIAAVSGVGQGILEVGVGNIDRIYVVVPLESRWEVAQGGVFSYYEFVQPRDQRLTDEEWRSRLATGEVPLPGWASNFILPGGEPRESLFFRVGDVYIISPAGDLLNVREQPSTGAKLVTQLSADLYVTIVDGPVQADGYTWWKLADAEKEGTLWGWAVEDQEWYWRSY